VAKTRYVRYATPAVLIFSVEGGADESDAEMEMRARRSLEGVATNPKVNDYGIPVRIEPAFDAIVWLGDGEATFSPDAADLTVEDMGEGL
jgi:hypothetical protein